MRTLYFTAFAIYGIAVYLLIETWAQAHREAHQRLLEELTDTQIVSCPRHGYVEPCGLCGTQFSGTSWPDSITVPNDNGTSITNG